MPGFHPAKTLQLQDTFKYFTRVCTANQQSRCAHDTCFTRYRQNRGVTTSAQEPRGGLETGKLRAPGREVGTHTHAHTHEL